MALVSLIKLCSALAVFFAHSQYSVVLLLDSVLQLAFLCLFSFESSASSFFSSATTLFEKKWAFVSMLKLFTFLISNVISNTHEGTHLANSQVRSEGLHQQSRLLFDHYLVSADTFKQACADRFGFSNDFMAC